MRLFAQLPARPDWYDRNPLVVSAYVETGAVAPHAATTRWTYTVPAGKKTALQIGSAWCGAVTLAAAVGDVSAFLQYTPSGGVAAGIVQPGFFGVAADLKDSMIAGATMVMLAGDSLLGRDYDTRTGGTCAFRTAFQGLEFDA